MQKYAAVTNNAVKKNNETIIWAHAYCDCCVK